GGRGFVQTGNNRKPSAPPRERIFGETVWEIHEGGIWVGRNDPRDAVYRPLLDDEARMRTHLADPGWGFLPARGLDHYVRGLEAAGFTIESVTARTIDANVDDWFQFLSAYHEAVLGWVGGSAKVDGRPADVEAVRDRLALIRHAMDTLFGGRPAFR